MTATILDLTASQLLGAFSSGELSPVEVLDAHLGRLDSVEPAINAFAFVDIAGAMAAAQAAERRWREGAPGGALDGVPVTVKDLFRVEGWPTTYGSAAIDPAAEPDEDSPSVARLREARAVLGGKTTTPEFGWKGTTDSPLFGITRNPWDTPDSWWIERRSSSVSGSRNRSARARHGRRGFDPDPGELLRAVCPQGHIGKGAPSRSAPSVLHV